MRIPIAEPLLKVLILEGLRRHDDAKYGPTVMRAYTDDLTATMDKLRSMFVTVEGLRKQQMMQEFAPTNLTSGSVAAAEGGSKSCSVHGPDCGHDDDGCIVQKIRAKEAATGRGRGGRGGRGGGRGRGGYQSRKRIHRQCNYVRDGKPCPYGEDCKFSHKAASIRHASGNRKGYSTSDDETSIDESSDDRRHQRARQSRKADKKTKRTSKRRKKTKKQRSKVAEACVARGVFGFIDSSEDDLSSSERDF